MLDQALFLASKNWPLFPLVPGTKRSLIKDYLNEASTDALKITDWWRSCPDANIGIATEAAGLVVIDIDVPKKPITTAYDPKAELFGEEAWFQIVDNAGLVREPRTYEVQTPSGGLHLYWKANPALPIKTGAGVLAPGIDVRAVKGSIVAAGSRTEKGSYECVRDIDPHPLPAWLRSALSRAGLTSISYEMEARESLNPFRRDDRGRTASPGDIKHPELYAPKILADELDLVRNAPSGQGNVQLNKSAFALRRLVEKGLLDGNEVADLLLEAATARGRPVKEAVDTIKSGLGV